MTFEVRVDCPHCSVEGTRIETWDDGASCRLAVPSTTLCRLCGHAAEGRVPGVERPAPGDGCPGCGTGLDDRARDGAVCPSCGTQAMLVDTRGASPPADATALVAALERWAREEGLGSASDLVAVYFVLASLDEVRAAFMRGERLETTFDVADYLFSGGIGAGGGGPAIVHEEDAPPTIRNAPPSSLRRPAGGPREELLALASVAAADGEANVDDAAVLVRAAQKRNLPPLPPEDVRVWRPNEIEPPGTLVDRERVLEEMFQMGWADGQMDESELRVIRDYARAWGIDPERLREWTELYSFGDQNRFERWFRRLGFFLFPAR